MENYYQRFKVFGNNKNKNRKEKQNRNEGKKEGED